MRIHIHIHKPKISARFINFFLALLTFIILAFILLSFSPNGTINIKYITIPVIIIFYGLLFLFFLFLGKALTRHFVHGINIGLFILLLLLLKTNNLFQPYLVLLVFLFIVAIEFAFWPKRIKI